MAKTLPTGYTQQDTIALKTRSPIRASDWNAVAAQQNYLYSRRGERIGGLTFYIPWENNTTVYQSASTNTNTLKSLLEFIPVFTLRKRILTTTNLATRFTVQIYGRDYLSTWELIDAEDGVTVVATGNVNNTSASFAWAISTVSLNYSQVMKPDGSPRPLVFNIIARRSSVKAEILELNCRAAYLTVGELPTREHFWERFPFSATFTPAGATGHLGPTQGQVDTAYDNTLLENQVAVIDNGTQVWKVPFTGKWQITAAGAGFDAVTNQRGAKMVGKFDLQTGEELRIVVGQVAAAVRHGSGGTFVAKYDRILTGTDTYALDSIQVVPLIIAGGAGGTLTTNNAATSGQITEAGGTSSTGALGGVGGLGGAGSGFALGGGGFRGNGGGADGLAPFNIAQSFLNGAEGNLVTAITPNQPGSFGGGGTGRTTTNYRFGGGGGYGGGGAANTVSSLGYGGGGGSFITTSFGGTLVTSTVADNIGDGYVIVEYVGV
jgi:hypothetical protein